LENPDKEAEMGKVVATEFVTLDGVMQDPGGSGEMERGGWSFKFDRGEEGDKFKLKELMDSDAQLLGRVTYQGFAEAWPTMKDDAGFAEKMNGMPKHVVSTTLNHADWENSEIIGENVADEVAKLKDKYDGDILIAGSATLVQSLMEDGLIDEYRLMVFPIVLGEGKRLFAEGADVSTLELTETKRLGPDGIVLNTYAPK
jgi:dihydrofolate reductase